MLRASQLEKFSKNNCGLNNFGDIKLMAITLPSNVLMTFSWYCATTRSRKFNFSVYKTLNHYLLEMPKEATMKDEKKGAYAYNTSITKKSK
jgi:hypothetical protein